MAEKLTIEIKNAKVLKVLQGLEEIKMIKIINDPFLGLTGKKKKHGITLLGIYKKRREKRRKQNETKI